MGVTIQISSLNGLGLATYWDIGQDGKPSKPIIDPDGEV